MCSGLILSYSYHEAVQLESSAMVREESLTEIEKRTFMQFVCANANGNVYKLDDENSFHEMEGYYLHKPLVQQDSPRLKVYASADKA